jgi:phosphate:Na+ symporter
VCGSLAPALATASREASAPGKYIDAVQQAADALRQAKEFMSGMNGPPESEDEQRRLTSTLHAIDHASRLAETANEGTEFGAVNSGPEDVRAVQLCAEAMRSAAVVAREVAVPPAGRCDATPIETPWEAPGSPAADALSEAAAMSTDDALIQLEHCAKTLGELRSSHRSATLNAVASGALTASEAIVRVDTVRRLDALAHHAWRSAAQLVGRGA